MILVAGVGLLVVPLAVDGVSAALHPVVSGNDTCRILTVIDGDTVTLTCAGSGVATARLMGFDAPELFSPECAGELIAAQKAQWALRAAIFTAKKIKLQREGRDRYDRTLVWIWLDGKPIHRTMISQGYGRAYDGGQRGVWCD